MSDWIEQHYQEQREKHRAQKGGPGSGHHGHAGRPGKRGGSLPGKGGGSSPSRERRTLYEGAAVAKAREIERDIWHRTKEVCVAISPSGEALVSAVGDEDSVSMTTDEKMLIKGTRGSIMTHNHPYGSSGFSLSDLVSAAMLDLEEIRVVHKPSKRVYYMGAANVRFGKYKDRNWPPVTDIKRVYNKHWEMVGLEKASSIANRKITLSAADFAFGAEVCRRTAEEFGLEFGEEEL